MRQSVRVSVVLVFVALFALIVSNGQAGEVSGPYASKLSPADVQQIKAAISKQSGIAHNVKKLEAVRLDKVAVQTTSRTAVDQDTSYDFNIYKRSGRWTIDSNSIQISIDQRDFRTNGPAIIR